MSKFMMLKILTPSGCSFRGEIKSITLPSIGGEIGLLPGHMPFISGLKSGKIKIIDSDNVFHSIHVNSGSIRLYDDKCAITIFDEVAKSKTGSK